MSENSQTERFAPFLMRIRNAAARLRRYWRFYVLRDPFETTVRSWFRDRGDTTLRLEYPLTSGSLVFDVGGFRGDWAQAILERYDATVFIFEPLPSLQPLLLERFANSSNVRVFCFGLYDSSCTETIAMIDDQSSIFKVSTHATAKIRLVDIAEFVQTNEIQRIDLVKINIEGAEYRLLNRMLDTGIADHCQDIQIQFHTFYPNAATERAAIRQRLSRTHCLTYDYPFVWENWRRLPR